MWFAVVRTLDMFGLMRPRRRLMHSWLVFLGMRTLNMGRRMMLLGFRLVDGGFGMMFGRIMVGRRSGLVGPGVVHIVLGFVRGRVMHDRFRRCRFVIGRGVMGPRLRRRRVMARTMMRRRRSRAMIAPVVVNDIDIVSRDNTADERNRHHAGKKGGEETHGASFV